MLLTLNFLQKNHLSRGTEFVDLTANCIVLQAVENGQDIPYRIAPHALLPWLWNNHRKENFKEKRDACGDTLLIQAHFDFTSLSYQSDFFLFCQSIEVLTLSGTRMESLEIYKKILKYSVKNLSVTTESLSVSWEDMYSVRSTVRRRAGLPIHRESRRVWHLKLLWIS